LAALAPDALFWELAGTIAGAIPPRDVARDLLSQLNDPSKHSYFLTAARLAVVVALR
jgi:hypothetical protein